MAKKTLKFPEEILIADSSEFAIASDPYPILTDEEDASTRELDRVGVYKLVEIVKITLDPKYTRTKVE